MKSKLLVEGDLRMFALVFDTGDEVAAGLTRFAKQHAITGASFTAIGAFSSVKLAYFNIETREYEELPLHEQVEVLTLAGNLAVHEGQPKLHAHVVVGRRDGSTRGGHLVDASVRPTLEVVLTETPAWLRRQMDGATGLPLIDLDA